MKKSPLLSLASIPAVLLCAALALASVAFGDVPRAISYQGYLTDDAGDPLTGPVNITFRLFAVEGPAIWTEPHGTVQLNEGRFAVALGEVAALPADFSQPLFLEIEVNGETLSPRLPLRSAPYALQAGKVDTNGVDRAAVAAGAIDKSKLAKDIADAGLAQNADGSLRVALAGIGSAMIADSAISNQHVSSTAAIAPSKISGTAVTLNGNETLTGKTLSNPVLTIDDSRFTITDDADPTYSVRLQLAPKPTRTLQRTLVVPDADGTLALESYVQTYVGTQFDALPNFARRDESNIFTAPDAAISLEPVDASQDAVLLRVMADNPYRIGDGPSSVFAVDAEGDVMANSFTGDGSGLFNLDAGRLATGYLSPDRVDYLPVTKITGLAAVAKSGSYAELVGTENVARRDEANTFTAGDGALTFDPIDAIPETVLLQVSGYGGRGASLFSVDTEGDVVANSFAGDGSLLTNLDASRLVSGTVSLDLLPDNIPNTKIDGLAAVATSGSFVDLADTGNLARRDEMNTYTDQAKYTGPGTALTLAYGAPQPTDTTLIQVFGGIDGLAEVFKIDSEGDVTAGSFHGDGSGLLDLDASQLTTGYLSPDRIDDLPVAKISGLADVATSGSFLDLVDTGNVARRDEPNTFTAGDGALTFDPIDAIPETVLLQVSGYGGRGASLFSVDTEGDVVANSFAGDGSLLTNLDASRLVSGTVSLDLLPDNIPNTKIDGLADVATSGSFMDLADTGSLARRDELNTYTDQAKYTGPGTALTLAYGAPQPTDTTLIQVFGGIDGLEEVFKIDGEGDVTAGSFHGDGSGLLNLNASQLLTGYLSPDRISYLPVAKITGLADVATSGGFADLLGTENVARRDQANVFTADSLPISLEPTGADAESVLLQIMSQPPIRARAAVPTFTVTAGGRVTAGEFIGIGTNLTGLDASNLTFGTVPDTALPLITSSMLDYGAVDGDALQDGVVTDIDVASNAAIDFSKIHVGDNVIQNQMLLNDSFSVFLDVDSYLTGSSSVALGGTLDLSLDVNQLAGTMAGSGLVAGGDQLAVDLGALKPALANDLAGKGLHRDGFDDTLAVTLGSGLTLDGSNAVTPDVDDTTVTINGDGKLAVPIDNTTIITNGDGKLAVPIDNATIGLDVASKLAVTSVVSVPIVVDTNVPTVPAHGSLIFMDGALQVYNDPEHTGDGTWIKIGTYQ